MQTELLSIQALRRELLSLDDLYMEYNDFRKETAVLKKKYQGALYCLKSTRAKLADLQRLNEQLQASFITVEDYNTIVSKSQTKEDEYNNLQAEYNDFINSSELRYQNICHKYDETILSLELQNDLHQQENEDLKLKIEKLDKKQVCKKKLENDKGKLSNGLEKDCINEFELEKQHLLENEIKLLYAKSEELEDKIRCLKLNNEAYEIRLKEQKEKHDEKIKNLSEQFEKEKCTLKQHFETILKEKDDEIKSVKKEVIKGNPFLDALQEASAAVKQNRCRTPIEFESSDIDEDDFQEALSLARSIQLVSPIPSLPEEAVHIATSASSPVEQPRNYTFDQLNKFCEEDINTGCKLIIVDSLVNCEDKQPEELCKKNVEVDKNNLPLLCNANEKLANSVINHSQKLFNGDTKETNKSSSLSSTANNFVQKFIQEKELQSNVNSPTSRKRRIEHTKKLDKKSKLSIVSNSLNSMICTGTVAQANNLGEKSKNPTPNQTKELLCNGTTSIINRCSNLPKQMSAENFKNCKVNQIEELHEKNSRKLDQCYNLSATDGVGKFNQSINYKENIESFDKFLSVALLSTKKPTTSACSQMQELQHQNIEGSCSNLPTLNDFGSSKLDELPELQIKNAKYEGSYSTLPITNGFGNPKLKQAKETFNENVEKVDGHYNLSTASRLQELQNKNTRHSSFNLTISVFTNPEFDHTKDLVNGDNKKVDKLVVNFKNSAVNQTQELPFEETNQHVSVCTASSSIQKSKHLNDNQQQEFDSRENLNAKPFSEKRNLVSKPKKQNKKSKSMDRSSNINSKLQVDIYNQTLPGMSDKRATKLLQQLLQFHEDKNVINIAKAFLKQRPSDIAKLVLQQVVLNKQSEILKKKDRMEPPLTITEQVLLKLMVALERLGTTGVRDAFLGQVEELLPTLTNLDSLLPITRLYVAICRQNFDVWRLRLTLCNSFILMHDLAIPFIHCMVRSWTEVLPIKDAPARNHIIARAIVCLILFKKCNQPGYNLSNLRQLLFKYYEYSSDVQDSKELLIELFDCFIKERNDCAEVLALALCETLDKKWVFSHIDTKLKESIMTRNSIYEVFYIIRLVTSVTKYFQKDLDATLVENNKLWLKQFCDGPFPDCVKDGAKVSLLRLSKCK